MKPVQLGISLLILLLGQTAAAQDAVYGYEVINSFPHNINAFTQGLVYQDGYLYEGTGKNGQSSLSKLNLENAEVLMSKPLNRRFFGEGIEIVDDKIYQLTWQSHMVFVYDKNSFDEVGSHFNPTEGWGLTYDGESLILSDGTDTLQFIDPENFTQKSKIQVVYNDAPVRNLNELEYINGEIWANVWQTDYIVRIDPSSGKVNSLIDLTGLSNQTQVGGSEAVLNGIAWDSERQRLFVTGKYWANLFEIQLVER